MFSGVGSRLAAAALSALSLAACAPAPPVTPEGLPKEAATITNSAIKVRFPGEHPDRHYKALHSVRTKEGVKGHLRTFTIHVENRRYDSHEVLNPGLEAVGMIDDRGKTFRFDESGRPRHIGDFPLDIGIMKLLDLPERPFLEPWWRAPDGTPIEVKE